jgi:hypothetical protein
MSFERVIPAPPAEPAPILGAAQGQADASTGITPAMRLQILSTEHWSLLASRNLAWNEAFSRTGIFLTALSGAIVALALVAQATAFGEGFRLFGLVILPVVLFIGIGTQLRLDSSGYHDVLCIIGMNRIRSAYLEMAPDLEPYFVMGTTDDFGGIELTMANPPGRSLAASLMAATPWLVTVLDSLLIGAIASLVSVQLGATAVATVLIGVVLFLAGMAVHSWWARREITRLMAKHRPRFPEPEPERTAD